ncbi:hypothetical protein OHA37_12080 [Streptomyces sp. NBC_00335]|uniref:hypothetical protein n=1 Tax=unclassified Streptomyces TaxID=2593676 RepID=UPI002252EBA3|nr:MULTISPECIES: hypothetical protein [unclassified Streptomyces]MCX5404618.1 hypothetical protein [Streptomyces sp. NBC_00086]
MTRLLCWPHFYLDETPKDSSDEPASLTFGWTWGTFRAFARNCESVSLRDQDGTHQLILRFRQQDGEGDGLIIIRLAVPAERRIEAQEFAELLRRTHSIPETAPPEPGPGAGAGAGHDHDDAALVRIAPDDPEWLVSPASGISETLYAEVLDRMAAGSAV